EWRDGIAQDLRAQTPARELGDGLLGTVRRTRDEGLAQQPQFRWPGEERAAEQRPGSGGQRNQLARLPDVATPGGGRGLDAARPELELGGQLLQCGAGEHGARSCLEAEPAILDGVNGAADTLGRLQHRDATPATCEQPGRGETADAAADDCAVKPLI